MALDNGGSGGGWYMRRVHGNHIENEYFIMHVTQEKNWFLYDWIDENF